MVIGSTTWWSPAILVASILLFLPQIVCAQLGPIETGGFLEYQYRRNTGTGPIEATSNIGTLQTNVSTYVWRPWIMRVNALLNLTKTASENVSSQQSSTLVTGALNVNLFRQSRFPFMAYYDTKDSRVDGDLPGTDILNTTYGFMQKYMGKGGGQYSMDYRHRSVESLFNDGSGITNEGISDTWQIRAQKSLGRNLITLDSLRDDVSRSDTNQKQNRFNHTLRHRFNSGRGFFLEDTTFFSDEQFETDDVDRQRRFLQFNGVSTWRPQTKRPLLIIGRGLLQGTETGNEGVEQMSKNMAMTASANYGYTDRINFGANVGIAAVDSSGGEEIVSTFQQLMASYRSEDHDLWNSRYQWGATIEAGNRSGDEKESGDIDRNDEGSVQNINLRFNHTISKNYQLSSGRQFTFHVAQQIMGAADSDNRRRTALTHTGAGTLSNQNGNTTSYVRLSISDGRLSAEADSVSQLVNLQLSRNRQTGRNRSWGGNLTMQYGRTVLDSPDANRKENKTVSYSGNLHYMQRDLFDISDLTFTSELRLLSSEFVRVEEMDDGGLVPVRERTDLEWRNWLDYRVGKLQIRLTANMSKTRDVHNFLIFLRIRRLYGFR